jgi:hypothetical protein
VKNRPQAAVGPELLWSGTDAAICGVIASALEKAGIPYHIQSGDAGSRSSSPPAASAIFIPARHHVAAQAVLKTLRLKQ